MYDLAIIGGGPAGISAAVYAARKRIKTILITDNWGGQSAVSPEIQNWIGDISISGAELGKKMRAHAESYAGDSLVIHAPHRVTKIEDQNDEFCITTTDSKICNAKTILLAMGANRRKLEIPGAKEYDQKGLTYCASCDGPLYADQDVAVIGGGNAAFETAMQLLAYCKSVSLFNRGASFRADELTVEKVLNNSKMKAFKNTVLVAVEGEKFVTGLRYKDATGAESILPVAGIFVEIGLIPNTEVVKGIVTMNTIGQIITDPRTQKTSHDRIWAAGDLTDGLYHQNNIASGDSVKALEDIYLYLHHSR